MDTNNKNADKLYISREIIRKIIELGAYEDSKGDVWGMDTYLGKMDELINDAIKIVNENKIFNVKDKLPNVECGSFLVYAPKSFPKNSRWLVAEYYDDVKGFYSESFENYLDDVTHWTELPDEPKA